MKADRSAFWRGPRRGVNKVESPRESVISMRKTGTIGIARNKSEELVFIILLCGPLSMIVNQSGMKFI